MAASVDEPSVNSKSSPVPPNGVGVLNNRPSTGIDFIFPIMPFKHLRSKSAKLALVVVVC